MNFDLTRVLTVYNHSCAVCDVQLELVQAAHIIPVPVGGTRRVEETGGELNLLLHNLKLTRHAHGRRVAPTTLDFR